MQILKGRCTPKNKKMSKRADKKANKKKQMRKWAM